MLEKRQENMQMTFTPKILCLRIRACRICIKNLDFKKVLGVMHMDFFSKYFGGQFLMCESYFVTQADWQCITITSYMHFTSFNENQEYVYLCFSILTAVTHVYALA